MVDLGAHGSRIWLRRSGLAARHPTTCRRCGRSKGHCAEPAGARGELLGRDAAVKDVAEQLHAERLVSLVGIGGTGKTRLALGAAAEVIEDFPDGVWFVDPGAGDRGAPPRRGHRRRGRSRVGRHRRPGGSAEHAALTPEGPPGPRQLRALRRPGRRARRHAPRRDPPGALPGHQQGASRIGRRASGARHPAGGRRDLRSPGWRCWPLRPRTWGCRSVPTTSKQPRARPRRPSARARAGRARSYDISASRNCSAGSIGASTCWSGRVGAVADGRRRCGACCKTPGTSSTSGTGSCCARWRPFRSPSTWTR